MIEAPQPPKWADRFLRWFCSDQVLEFLQGDLYEMYADRLARYGKFRAGLLFTFDVFSACRPFAFRMSGTNSNSISMLQHNLKLTFRNFRRHKSQFLINLAGLSTGLACVLLIYLWVVDERQMDGYHANDAQLYQVMSNHKDASGIFTWKGVPGLLLEEIEGSVPEVKHTVALTDPHEFTLSAEDSYFKAEGKFVSQDFFEVFTFPLLKGNKETALRDKSGIVITQSLALRLFKSTDVIGTQLTWHFQGKEKTVQVSAVMEDLLPHTSQKFDFLMSWDYFHDDLIDYKNWYNYYGRIATVLNSGADKSIAEAKIDAILKEKQGDDRVDLFLTRFSDQYLYNNYENGVQAGGRIEYVNLFSAIALFILFIACINFINLSTAKASHRTKEIGVKKAMGASRSSLIGQFFTESLLLSTFSMLIAVTMVWLLLPQFNFITQKQLSLRPDGTLLMAATLLVLLVGLLAGGYPALYLSGLRSIEVLKGKLAKSTGELLGRRVLVVLQFSLSIIMIVSVVVVYQQMDFVRSKNLGYDRDNLIYFEREGKLIDHPDAFLAELRSVPGVSNAALSGFMVGGANSTGGVSWEGKTEKDQIQFWEIRSGYGLIEIMGVEVLEGRTFSEEFGSDSSAVLFNESAIAAMGMEDPIGKTISHYSGDRKIIGVVKDFNLVSLHKKVEPAIFLFEPKETYSIMAKLRKGNERMALEKIESLFTSFNPGYVFKPQFVDQDYEALYASEERVSTLSRYFAGLAILISCLGLFGLAAFTTERRIKEIGIRKVLGSGVMGIVFLLSKDFTKMVLTAILIAIPVAYFLATSWLEDFAYSIDLKWWFFLGSALVALITAWVTVGLQTFRAANANPTECLRDE